VGGLSLKLLKKNLGELLIIRKTGDEPFLSEEANITDKETRREHVRTVKRKKQSRGNKRDIS